MGQQKTFCKSRNCPSTEELLLFSSDALESDQTGVVIRHLEECEFCFSELRLLTDFPPLPEECKSPEMPFQLRQLAEMMLGGETLESSFLGCLFIRAEDFPVAVRNTRFEKKEKGNYSFPFLFRFC